MGAAAGMRVVGAGILCVQSRGALCFLNHPVGQSHTPISGSAEGRGARGQLTDFAWVVLSVEREQAGPVVRARGARLHELRHSDPGD